MSSRSRARIGLLVVLALLPVAAAQAVPTVPDPTATPTPGLPPVDPPVATPAPPSAVLDIHEGPLTITGPATSPSHVLVTAQDGSSALEYWIDDEGNARLDVAGENAIADATLLRMKGDPTGDAFALVLRDPQGGIHEVTIDRAALTGTIPIPDLPVPPVNVARPALWPGAPEKSYLLSIEDGAKNHLGASQLDGSAFLQKGGTHRATIQIPIRENQWDRFVLQSHRAGSTQTMNATFAIARETADALVLAAPYAPSLLGLAEGDRVVVDVLYEKRLTPFVAEIFLEPGAHSYLVDGAGPTVTLNAPAEANDFKFDVSWTGQDALSGIGGFALEWRESGASSWTRWFTTSDPSATFSGDWGKSYEFRAHSLDAVGNPSPEALGLTHVAAQPAGEDDINDPPTARILTPRAGSLVSGATIVTWVATDPDGTPVTSKLEVSDDDGDTWRTLYSGSASTAIWDTTSDADGPGFRLRLTVSDGTQTAADAVSALTLRNVVAPPAPDDATPDTPETPASAPNAPGGTLAGGTHGEDGETAPAADGTGGKDTPMPLAVVAVGIVSAALLLRRRKM